MNQTTIVILLVYGLYFTKCCSVSTTSRKLQPVQVRARKAQTIVYGQVLKIFPLSPPPGAHSWRLYSAEFKLLCPLKNIQFLTKIEEAEAGNQDELLFNVTNMGHATGRCLNDDVERGKNYFLFIRESSYPHSNKQRSIQQFLPDQVNGQPAALLDTTENRNFLKEFSLDCGQILQENIPEEVKSNIDFYQNKTTLTIRPNTSSFLHKPWNEKLNEKTPFYIVTYPQPIFNEADTTTRSGIGSKLIINILLEMILLLSSVFVNIALI